MRHPNTSCLIYKRTGEVERIESRGPPTTNPPGVPTTATLVPVTDVMTRDVLCGFADLAIETIVDLIVNNYIGCLPIVDQDGRPIGIITKRDLVEPMANRVNTADESPTWREIAPRTADEAMLPIAYTLDETATVAQAAALMAAEDLHHIPIVSTHGRLVGLISALDIVRWLATNDGFVPSMKRVT